MTLNDLLSNSDVLQELEITGCHKAQTPQSYLKVLRLRLQHAFSALLTVFLVWPRWGFLALWDFLPACNAFTPLPIVVLPNL